jgi:hypothetical protein
MQFFLESRTKEPPKSFRMVRTKTLQALACRRRRDGASRKARAEKLVETLPLNRLKGAA